jgi:hypothetical protein
VGASGVGADGGGDVGASVGFAKVDPAVPLIFSVSRDYGLAISST